MIGEAIEAIVTGQDLEPATMESVLDRVLAGEATEAQIAALVIALRMKGEAVGEIVAAARAMRHRCTSISPRVDGPLLDTCGTGGDGLRTFNISTAAALVAAASGVPVAKHGNRAATSQAGSADVLEALGVRIDRDPDHVCRAIEQVGIGFLFAQAHHGALRHAAPVRRQLKGRTIFNLLGPLSNPAGATHQLVGVYAEAPIDRIASALGELGTRRAWVVRGHDGLDEVSPAGPTSVAVLDRGDVRLTELTPSDFGLEPVAVSALEGGDARTNADVIRRVLAGEKGAARTAVLINAAACLCVAEVTKDLKEAVAVAQEAIDDGAARNTLARWVEFTRGL